MKKIALAVLAFTPMVAFAQTNPAQLYQLFGIVQTVLGYIVPIVIVLGVIYVIWGVIQFVTKTDEEERGKAKGMILYGIIGLFVVVSIWGLVGFLQNLTGVGGGHLSGNQIPCVLNTGGNTGC
jgi:hypothetical protein